MPRAVRPFEFAEGDSFLHRLNPVTKLLMIFSVTALVITFLDPLVGLAIVVALYALAVPCAPILAAQIREIIDAYQSRCFKVYYLNPLRRIRAFLALLPPTIFATLRRAQWTSVALEMKGFTYPGERTYRQASTLRPVDKALIAFQVGLIGLASYASNLRLPKFVFTQPLSAQLAALSLLHLLGGFFLI